MNKPTSEILIILGAALGWYLSCVLLDTRGLKINLAGWRWWVAKSVNVVGILLAIGIAGEGLVLRVDVHLWEAEVPVLVPFFLIALIAAILGAVVIKLLLYLSSKSL